jgi:periplasmic divalent cation tolerance protein
VAEAEPEHIVVLVTAGGEQEARTIARELLDAKLAACVNVIDDISSFFFWQGKQEMEHESLLVIKSKGRLLTQIIETVKKAHSYKVPEVIALPVTGGNRDYLDWIDSEVRP